MSVFIIVLCLINLGLWFLFLWKFKDLFNTDKIIEKTRREMDKLVRDINNNAETNINVIDDRIRKVKSYVKELDSKFDQIETRMSLLNKQISDVQKPVKHTSTENKSSRSSKRPVNESQAADRYKENSKINPAASYGITETGKKMVQKQNTLFDDDYSSGSVIETSVHVNVQSDGSSYAEIPVVATEGFKFEVIDEKKQPSSVQQSSSGNIKSQVLDMFHAGIPADLIASKLSISPAEVEFIVSFNNE